MSRSGSDFRLRVTAAIALVVGSILGTAGTFTSSASWRGLAWGLDGTALIMAAALLAVHHFRKGNDVVAAGFLVFLVGEALIVPGAAMDLEASRPLFAAGAALWSASLALVSSSRVMPPFVRVVGFLGSLLFAVVALPMFVGGSLTALSRPLPFFAYPFLVATLLGWAWVHYRRAD